MKLQLIKNNDISFGYLSKSQMSSWRKLNNIPEYVNASYAGYTGAKHVHFPRTDKQVRLAYPDITKVFQRFEEEILQDIKNTRRSFLGYFKVLWKMGQNFSTGEAWDTKFLPDFPGRDKNGKKQYAIYNNQIVSGNDISNILFGHVCAYLGFSKKLTQFIAKMDACGVFEPFVKGCMPNKELIKFRDTKSDQNIMAEAVENFDLASYKLL